MSPPSPAGAVAPVETKVAAGASVSTVTGVVTWVLVSFVPAFKTGLPPTLATFLPYIVSSILGAAAAYLSPHTARPDPSASPADAPAVNH